MKTSQISKRATADFFVLSDLSVPPEPWIVFPDRLTYTPHALSPPNLCVPAWRALCQVVAKTLGAAADSSTALCFRARVHLPALVLSVAPNVAAAAASAPGSAMEVTVCLRSRGKLQLHEERVTSTGFVALGGPDHGLGLGGVGGGEEEVWEVGKVSIPLPGLLSAPRW